ncbi:hypothetical protein A2W14_05435 [Candidatus Gottesmanbacteria bacterium RBG_16_37_8]|uniref:Uncharacterized protein n=1 Tax=Candidatus Gottesmanbacteria bacterium RBG_16_37_8 TaxID=1798371 RepID=A0A1F5YUW3_9BACT|nr:MAG: hypothetical protein A2W14_05435 [Candidatus Gottesmanbacteria bacterium RBG_16_37_8]
MIKINLKLLLSITPMAQETKDKIMVVLDEFDEDRKIQLETLCWETLAELIDINYKKESAKLLQEIDEGKRKYNSNDFMEIRAKIIHDISEKLHMAETKEELELVRQKLEQHSKNNIIHKKPSSL